MWSFILSSAARVQRSSQACFMFHIATSHVPIALIRCGGQHGRQRRHPRRAEEAAGPHEDHHDLRGDQDGAEDEAVA
eukprot:6824634-Alexandrium_andersonii.AAC.1